MSILRHSLFLLAVIVAVALLLPAENAPTYDVKKEVTVRGTVQGVREYKCPISGTIGTHLKLKSGQDVFEVHVASAKFVKQFDIALRPGDELVMVGNTITFDGQPAFLPRMISINQSTYYFRDAKGKPIW
jgi:hypothetical protein